MKADKEFDKMAEKLAKFIAKLLRIGRMKTKKPNILGKLPFHLDPKKFTDEKIDKLIETIKKATRKYQKHKKEQRRTGLR